MMKLQNRKYSQLPILLICGLLLSFSIQITFNYVSRSAVKDRVEPLASPRESMLYKALALGSDQLMGDLLLLKVQLHDNQIGRHLNYQQLNYVVLKQWILMVSRLIPASEYPGFLASRVYSSVQDPNKLQIMIDVITQLFEQNPALNWRRMTEATLIAKHKMKDLPQALILAEKVANVPDSIKLPFWARDMKLILLDELGEKESALILISSMLQSGEIKDNDEKRFLESRLLKIQQELTKSELK